MVKIPKKAVQSLDDAFSEQGRRAGFVKSNGFRMNDPQINGLRQADGFAEKLFFAFKAR